MIHFIWKMFFDKIARTDLMILFIDSAAIQRVKASRCLPYILLRLGHCPDIKIQKVNDFTQPLLGLLTHFPLQMSWCLKRKK